MHKKNHTGNIGLFIIMVTIYVGLLILFAAQTWGFVNWIFPQDALLMKILTVLCFDVMAMLWSCLDLFYRFASRGARTLVRWAWAISFILSLLASVFYLVIESMFRFQVVLTQSAVNIGYGISIIAVTLQVLFVTFWLYLEWSVRHPHMDEYEQVELDGQPDGHDPVGGGRRPHVESVTVQPSSGSNEMDILKMQLSMMQKQMDELKQIAASSYRVTPDVDSVPDVSIVHPTITLIHPVSSADEQLEQSIRSLLSNDSSISARMIAQKIGCSPTTASKWKKIIQNWQESAPEPA